jgi:hypothetical protein
MNTRLDFLEMYNRELRDALVAQGNGTRKVDDILALVAVARAAADHLHNMDSGDKLAATLAPLLQETSADAGDEHAT